MSTLLLSASTVLVLLVTGCAATGGRDLLRLGSFTDPAFAGRRFGSVLILLDTSDFTLRLKLERHISEKLRGATLARAVEGFAYLPPMRTWGAHDLDSVLRANGVEACLVIRASSSGAHEYHVPQTTTTTIEREEAKKKKTRKTEVVDPGDETITTTVQGGHTVREEWTRYTVELVDAGTGRTAWIGKDEIGWAYSDGIDWFAEKLANQLLTDGHLAAK